MVDSPNQSTAIALMTYSQYSDAKNIEKLFLTPWMCFHMPLDEELRIFLQTDSFLQNNKKQVVS